MAVRKKPYPKRAKKKPVSKAVQSYVRRVVNRKPEVKRTFFSAGSNYTQMTPKTFNVAYHMLARGVGEDGFIGNSITLKSLQIDGHVTNYASTYVNDTLHYNIAVIKTDKFVTLTSLGLDDVYCTQGATPLHATQLQFDRHKVTVLASHFGSVRPTIASSACVGSFQVRAHLRNAKLEFKDWNDSEEGKDYNIYIVCIIANLLGTFAVSTSGGVTFRAQLMYTDS